MGYPKRPWRLARQERPRLLKKLIEGWFGFEVQVVAPIQRGDALQLVEPVGRFLPGVRDELRSEELARFLRPRQLDFGNPQVGLSMASSSACSAAALSLLRTRQKRNSRSTRSIAASTAFHFAGETVLTFDCKRRH